MNKNDCYIVKDLSLGYIENVLNINTRKFIEKHLSECSECREYYNSMRANILEDTNFDDRDKDKIEINYLKKIRNHINIFKFILITILICSIVIISFLVMKYYYISNIFDQAYMKTETMKELDNYKLKKRTIKKDFSEAANNFDVTFTYYYKDGKYKIEYGDSSTSYLEDNSYTKICVYDDVKQIEYYTQNFVEERKGEPINIFLKIVNYKNLYTEFDILGLSLKEDKFEGKDCYVIRKGDNDSYSDIWIDKDTLTVVRAVSEDKSKNYIEEIYTFSENVVMNEDVDSSILKTEKYKDYKVLNVTNNATEEMKLYYELVDKIGR